tara:strand:+ start:8964 stop:9539 length:576 start_codon:yes stop_codon:yes gene_type:complete
MKIFSFALLALSFNAFGASYNFASDQSKLEWEGKKVSGAHQGTVALKSGSVELEKGTLKGGEVVVNLENMTVTDLQGEWADKLVGHLKSDDFFSVKDHPNVTFKIKSVKKLKGDQFSVTGPLTIKGKEAVQTFNVTVKESAKQVSVVGEINIDRTTYNIKYGSGKFFDPKTLGDKMISDQFTIKLNLIAAK